MTAPLRRTPLHALHVELGARLVPFAGYEMPVQYQGIIAEHNHARTKAVLFDVSHMGQARLPIEASAALERLVVADLAGLQAGKVRYSVLTNAEGGIIDDLMIVQCGSHLWLIVNASRKEVDFAHIAAHLPAGQALTPQPDLALLALQGPAAADVLKRFAPAAKLMLFMTSETLRIGDVKCAVCRSGYTGEDGFEISVPADQAEALARMLLDEPEVMPAGLGARDTLRLEAGLCLYGHEIDETTTPIEAGLAWTIQRRRREEGGFLGDKTILRQLVEGAARRRVGIRFEGRAAARTDAPIVDSAGRTIGTITSGSFSPTLQAAIAMGYVSTESSQPGTPVAALVRGKPVPGEVVPLPFVPHRYAKP
ncbi:MAG: glycine cleavage system aminomethyltransferase GcvT [Defluviicoccus sp.]|nr:glycine cleavage system aminomethyltransferase GcvT [Defluviicoccus sp.]MDG4608100.1 glycine cleavage system aminomethyltransferase GcvT [Defluviicoccus sp.]